MAIVPHQDDFEFNMGGTFACLRDRYGLAVDLKVVITSKGASGHHEMDPDNLFSRRMQEARESASLIGATAECLTQLDGTHVDAQVLVTRNLLGGIWNSIRSFGAHYVFCPPVVSDPLAAIHIDHEETARAVRMVGYQLSVPKAYPATMPTAGDKHYRPPVIILCDDTYSSEQQYDVAHPISNTYDLKVAMAKCHRSQVFEWLPFNRGMPSPDDAQFEKDFLKRHCHLNRRFGLEDEIPREYFRLSNWGRRPVDADVAWLFGDDGTTV